MKFLLQYSKQYNWLHKKNRPAISFCTTKTRDEQTAATVVLHVCALVIGLPAKVTRRKLEVPMLFASLGTTECRGSLLMGSNIHYSCCFLRNQFLRSTPKSTCSLMGLISILEHLNAQLNNVFYLHIMFSLS